MIAKLLLTLFLATAAYAANIDINAFRQQMLDCMNGYRDKHQVGGLGWNDDYINKAQNWAQHLIDTNTFEHQGKCSLSLCRFLSIS